jgi:hypothetical protein
MSRDAIRALLGVLDMDDDRLSARVIALLGRLATLVPSLAADLAVARADDVFAGLIEEAGDVGALAEQFSAVFLSRIGEFDGAEESESAAGVRRRIRPCPEQPEQRVRLWREPRRAVDVMFLLGSTPLNADRISEIAEEDALTSFSFRAVDGDGVAGVEGASPPCDFLTGLTVALGAKWRGGGRVIIAVADSPTGDAGDLGVVEEVARSGIALGLLSVDGWGGQLLDEIERVYRECDGPQIERRNISLPGSNPPALPGQIYVRFRGAHEALEAEPEWTVGDLKAALHERTTIAPRYQQLMVGDQLLDDDE